MSLLISVIHIVVCVWVVFIIMMQHRKSGGFTGNFGGGGTQADMSGGTWKRMNSLTRLSVILTGVFLLLSLIQMRI